MPRAGPAVAVRLSAQVPAHSRSLLADGADALVAGSAAVADLLPAEEYLIRVRAAFRCIHTAWLTGHRFAHLVADRRIATEQTRSKRANRCFRNRPFAAVGRRSFSRGALCTSFAILRVECAGRRQDGVR